MLHLILLSSSHFPPPAILLSLRLPHSTLSFLDLGVNKLGPEGAEFLAEALKPNTALTVLDVKGNRLYDGGAKALSHMLMMNTGIKT
jgi:hypothetical protein